MLRPFGRCNARCGKGREVALPLPCFPCGFGRCGNNTVLCDVSACLQINCVVSVTACLTSVLTDALLNFFKNMRPEKPRVYTSKTSANVFQNGDASNSLK